MISTTLCPVVIRMISRGIKVFLIRIPCFQGQSKMKTIPLFSSIFSRNINPNSLSCCVLAISRFIQFQLKQNCGSWIISVDVFHIFFSAWRKKKNMIIIFIQIIIETRLMKVLSVFLSSSFHIICTFWKVISLQLICEFL